uniref:Link domain-containing protein n=1 Tax=viral metagenome TaxID=1070528 RepID=A0A6C0CFY7_9ZZZZ
MSNPLNPVIPGQAPLTPVIPGGSTPTNMVLDIGATLMVVTSVLVLLTIVTFFATGSLLATLVVIAIVIGFVLLLTKLGIINIYYADGMLHVDYHALDGSSASSGAPSGSASGSAPAPAPSTTDQTASAPKTISKSEVFHVGNNHYSYDDAPAVCAAYDAELATYDQVNEAFALGAEWCAYGWSQGGMALYPTQQSTWQKLQSEPKTRTACGRPGVNGGYFDPATKFGVNCYGAKPADLVNAKYPLPLPGADPATFNAMVNRFKKMLGSIPVTAFNRLGWSEWNLVPHT